MPIPKLYENLDPTDNFKKHLTSGTVMNSLPVYSYCHDIVGIVVAVSKSHTARNILNFKLQIGDLSVWPVSVWDEDVNRLENVILVNDVIHIDGLYVKHGDKDPKYSLGQKIGFTIQTSSTVTNLTKLFAQNGIFQGIREDQLTMYTNIQTCVDENEVDGPPFGLTAFIKSTFVQGNPAFKLWVGALTDQNIKITTCVKVYNDSTTILNAGQKVKVFGHLIDFRGKIALEIEDLRDIKIIENEMCPVEDLRKAVNTPQKIKRSNENQQCQSVAKKLKMDG